MDYFLDSFSDLGHDSNSGTHRRSPRKTLAGAAALDIKPGDRLLIRAGSTFDTGLPWRFHGVTVMTYSLGTEGHASVTITLPHDKGMRGLSIIGKDNTFEDIQISGAETGVFVDPQATGNTFRRVSVKDFGHGYLIHGSHTTVDDVEIAGGKMIRNVTSADYVGASAFTLWKHEKYECTDLVLSNIRVRDAWAWRVSKEAGKDTDGDGSAVEIFGGVTRVLVTDMDVKASKIVCEMGGTKGRKETASAIRFVRCTSDGPSGKVAFWNDPNGGFPIAWAGVSFEDCHFKADGYPESPFYFAGNHGSLAGKLRVVNCSIVAAARVYNGGAGTDLESIQRANNRYLRSDGGTDVGVMLAASEVMEA